VEEEGYKFIPVSTPDGIDDEVDDSFFPFISIKDVRDLDPAVEDPDTLGQYSCALISVVEGEVAFPEEDPRLAPLKAKYEALDGNDRNYNGRVLSWEEVVKAIPNVGQMLEGASSLVNVEPYWIDEVGRLVLGDNSSAIFERLNVDYAKSRNDAMRVPGGGLITSKEVQRRARKVQFDSSKMIWCESGGNTDPVYVVDFRTKFPRSEMSSPKASPKVGSIHVVRIQLNLSVPS